MGQQFEQLNDKHTAFIRAQHIYFVATAAQAGQVNLSPKGGDSLRVIDSNTIAWLNLTGSGNETAAHILQQTRMTLMFCAFEGSPLILRCYGQAQVIHRGDPNWQQYSSLFEPSVAARQVYLLNIEMVQASCGMSVPKFDFVEDRDELEKWSLRQGDTGIEKYWLKKNQNSIDGFETQIAQRSGLASKLDQAN